MQEKLHHKSIIISDVAARYSATCCTRLIENNGRALLVLADLAQRCNRSLPHMEVVTTICDLFISLSELDETRTFLATFESCRVKIFDMIFHLMQMHGKDNKKSLFIFSKCCSFLWKLCHHEKAQQVDTITFRCIVSLKYIYILC